MQLKQNTKELGAIFLLTFTKELIKNSGSEIYELEKIIKKESFGSEVKEITPQKIYSQINAQLIPKKEAVSINMPVKQNLFLEQSKNQRKEYSSIIQIKEPRLPQSLQYLKPIPSNVQIELGKLNPLMRDPMVQSVECEGENKEVFVVGIMGRKKTNVILSKEEINEIIKKFSESAKIPIQEGIFKVAVGKFILTAVISEEAGSRFMIRKIGLKEIFPR